MFNSNYHLSTLTWQPIVISVNTYEALELHMPILRKEHLSRFLFNATLPGFRFSSSSRTTFVLFYDVHKLFIPNLYNCRIQL